MAARARPVAALVLALAAGAAALWSLAPGPAQPAGAQILDPDDPTTTTAPEQPTTTVVATTAPTSTEAPTTTEPPTTTAAPTTAPPATRAPTTEATTTAPPAPTTAPPGAPTTASTTTVPVDTRQRITQDTPALGGVIAVWLLGIAGVVAVLGAGWWRTRER